VVGTEFIQAAVVEGVKLFSVNKYEVTATLSVAIKDNIGTVKEDELAAIKKVDITGAVASTTITAPPPPPPPPPPLTGFFTATGLTAAGLFFALLAVASL